MYVCMYVCMYIYSENADEIFHVKRQLQESDVACGKTHDCLIAICVPMRSSAPWELLRRENARWSRTGHPPERL